MAHQDEDKTKAQLIAELQELRQREAALREKSIFLQQVIDINPHFIFAKDRAGRFTLANPAFARAYANIRAETLLGKTDADVNPNATLVERYRQDDLAVMESHRDLIISEERVIKPNGQILWRETIKRPIIGRDGQAHQVLGVITDITEQKQAKQALQLTQFTLDNVAEAVFWLGPKAEFLYVNKAACHALGYSAAELLRLRLVDIDPNYPPPVWQTLWAETQANPVTVESYHHPKAGRPFPVQARFTYLEFNEQAYCVVFARDITHQRRTLAALRESEDHLQQVFSSISDHIYVTEFTRDGQRLNHYLSPVEALTGYPLTRLLDDWTFWPSRLIHPDDRGMAAAQVEHFLKGQDSELEYRLIRADGRVIWVRDCGRVQRNEERQSIMVYGIISDITERKRAEEALKEAESRLLAVVDNTPIIVFALDQAGNFTLLEGKGLEAIGGRPGQGVGRSIFELYQDHPQIIEHAAYALAGQARAVTTDIGDVTFEVWYEPLRGRQQQIMGVVGVAHDITERKQAETAIAQALDQALEASRLKSQLLAKVTHELRTPLGAILGYTELLQDGTFGPLTEQQTRITAEVIDSANYLTHLVSELLDQAQFETGRARLRIAPFSLSEMAQRVQTKMGVLARAKKLTLTTHIAPAMPATIAGDEHRLQQILINLVSNAIKFTKTGSVQIRLYCLDPRQWALEVADTGPGISVEAQGYIFEPFRQVDGSITREHVGAGLGLSIVKQLVSLMGGRIELKSKIGAGSVFTVALPLDPIQEDRA